MPKFVWIEMFISSKEEILLGLVLIASGSSQLVYSLIFSESVWLVFGPIFTMVGIAITILGFVWTNRNPHGITVLGLGYGLSGFLVIFAGVLLFTPMLSLTALFFALSWGLIRRKSWARPASMLTTAIALSAMVVTSTLSTLLPAVQNIPYIPSILISIYVLWYLMRAHVSQAFDSEDSMKRRQRYIPEESNKKGLIPVVLGFLLLSSFLAYSYLNPPSGMPVAAEVNIRGSLGAGELGTPALGYELRFWASRGDQLNCSFRCTDAEPVHVWLVQESSQNTSETIFERIGLEDSGSVWAGQTGNYAMWTTTQRPGRADVLCEIWVTSFSLRRLTVQSLLLSLFGAAVSLYLVLTSKKPTTPI